MAMAAVRERLSGVEILVNKIVVNGAVISVRTRFRREVKKAAAHLSELRGEIAGLKGEFLNGLHRRLIVVSGSLRQTIGGILTFEHDLERRVRRAVDANCVLAAWLDPRARRERHESQGITNRASLGCGEIQRQCVDSVRAYGRALFGAFRLEQRRVRLYGNGIGSGAHLQRQIDSRRLRNLDDNVAFGEFLKAGSIGADVVHSGRKRRDGVISGGCGDSLVLPGGVRVNSRHRHIGNHRARGIRYCPGDGSPVALRPERRNQRKNQHPDAARGHRSLLTLSGNGERTLSEARCGVNGCTAR